MMKFGFICLMKNYCICHSADDDYQSPCDNSLTDDDNLLDYDRLAYNNLNYHCRSFYNNLNYHYRSLYNYSPYE